MKRILVTFAALSLVAVAGGSRAEEGGRPPEGASQKADCGTMASHSARRSAKAQPGGAMARSAEKREKAMAPDEDMAQPDDAGQAAPVQRPAPGHM